MLPVVGSGAEVALSLAGSAPVQDSMVASPKRVAKDLCIVWILLIEATILGNGLLEGAPIFVRLVREPLNQFPLLDVLGALFLGRIQNQGQKNAEHDDQALDDEAGPGPLLFHFPKHLERSHLGDAARPK